MSRSSPFLLNRILIERGCGGLPGRCTAENAPIVGRLRHGWRCMCSQVGLRCQVRSSNHRIRMRRRIGLSGWTNRGATTRDERARLRIEHRPVETTRDRMLIGWSVRTRVVLLVRELAILIRNRWSHSRLLRVLRPVHRWGTPLNGSLLIRALICRWYPLLTLWLVL